jgi:excisionase family DNA binding protein
MRFGRVIDNGYVKETYMPKRNARAVPTLSVVHQWPATISVTQAAEALGISKSHLYALIAAGESPVDTIPLGSRLRVVTASLIRVLDPHPEVAAA